MYVYMYVCLKCVYMCNKGRIKEGKRPSNPDHKCNLHNNEDIRYT